MLDLLKQHLVDRLGKELFYRDLHPGIHCQCGDRKIR